MVEMFKEKGFSENDSHVATELVYKPDEKKKLEYFAMVQNLIQANTNVELTGILKRMSKGEDIPDKWSRIKKPKLLNFLKDVMDYEGNPVKDEQLWDLVSDHLKARRIKKMENERITQAANDSVKANNGEKKIPGFSAMKKKNQKNTQKQALWATAIETILKTNTSEELVNSLKKISAAANIPHVKKWQEIHKIKFVNFLNNLPGYQMNPVIDEQLRILISKALQNHHIKQKDEKYLAKGFTAKPVSSEIKEEKNAEWLSLVTKLMDNDNEVLVSDAYEKITEHGNIPKTWSGIKKTDFKNFLKNNLGREVHCGMADNLWDLLSKVLQEKRAIKTKKIANQKAAEKAKIRKRKSDIGNRKPEINGSSAKKIKKEVELKTRENESCNPVSGAITVAQGEELCSKVKWSTIGKTILRAADDKELSLRKFQKKIVAEYLSLVGNAAPDTNVDTLWSKCQNKLSKNPKFQIDSKKIRLVS